MPLDARRPPAVLVFTVLAVLLGSLVALAHVSPEPQSRPSTARPIVSGGDVVAESRRGRGRERALRPVVTESGSWSGYAFDACRAPSQRTMDRWLHRSPFVGVGIYLGGIHRACEQRHLTPRWVARQTRNGWHLLPIWVGPQASCTGYDHRIPNQPARGYAAARRAGVRQAQLAVGAARRLGIGPGQVVFYDIEPYDTSRGWCRRSSLAFLDAWTRQMHRRGYRSGVYSHVRAAVASLSRAPRGVARPDAVWYAWIDRAGRMPREYVADPAFMRTSRVHQFALDTRVRFGGIRMAIDWNLVTIGRAATRAAVAPCGRHADASRPRELRPGQRNVSVAVVECLLGAVGRHRTAADHAYDARTAQAVRGFQKARGLEPTGAVDRRTWTALLAAGRSPLLKPGSAGEPVRRLQRSLNAALPWNVPVDGAFGRRTQGAVLSYQERLGHRATGVVTARTWRALAGGRVVLPSPAPKAASSKRPSGKAAEHGKAAGPGKASGQRRASKAAKSTKRPARKSRRR